MKFIEYLETNNEIDCGVIAAGIEMSCDLVWYGDYKLTDLCKEYFSDLLNAEVLVLDNGNIEILCDDENKAEEFFALYAGYCGINRYNSLFEERKGER